MVRQPVIRGSEEGPPDPPRKTPFGPTGGDDDQDRLDEELRPQRLEDIVGQGAVVSRLRIMLNAARKRKEPLGHLLLDGPPGLGKTTFATVLPRELGTECQITSGPVLSAPKDLLPYLTNASYGSVLFIDEIHRLPHTVEEFIYPVMEDFRVDISLGEGLNARTINMRLKQFTVIGATTRSGMLTAPLRDRFVHREHLDFYTIDELGDIVRRNARKLHTTISDDASHEIAKRSRGTPRIANNLLRWTRDFVDSEADGEITTALANEALARREVDLLGLDRQDRRYLETLIRVFGGGPAGAQAIAHSMNLSPDTLEDEVEPFLLRCGLLLRTPRGRMATAEAFLHLGMRPPDPDSGDRQGRLF
ncbi:MAG: Holliday junction branch migration DNA helicase RuvB [Planctomycetota bacterium]|nr:Holliday junction branch migration DNA helicase RuvB [Planctomycetota bacterium]